MSMGTKKWLAAAAWLVTVGAVLFAAAMATNHWDFSLLSTESFVTDTYEIEEGFSRIELNTETADILFAASEDKLCRVVCTEPENRKHSVGIRNGTLTIHSTDSRKWFEHIGISFQAPKVTVYLPKAEYESIVIKASTGDVEITDEIKVDSAEVSISTGDIRVNHISAGTVDCSASTGAIFISDTACTGDLNACITTGDVNVMNVTCRNFFSNGSTSALALEDVIAAEKITVERSTGDVELKRSDADQIFIKTSTGDVSGSLLSGKEFITDTSIGSISVPAAGGGGKCEIETSTGDINIVISDGSEK